MKKYLFMHCMLLLSTVGLAQQKPDLKQYEKQLKQAQQKMEAMRKAHPEIDSAMKQYNKDKAANQKLVDSVTKANGIKKMEIPDVSKYSHAAMPDFGKMQATQEQRLQQLQQMKSSIATANKAGLPQKSNAPFSVTKAANKDIAIWANALLLESTQKLDLLSKKLLDETYKDSTKNPASIGMLLMATGMPITMGQYLVCRYLADHPNNAMAINDLGIFLRLKKNYQKAIPTFLYAQQLNDSCKEIKTNLGWAYAYAGNFIKAKQYFNEVLKKQPNYSSALEGLSLMAYQEGDKQALWNNLAKQMLQHYRTGGADGSLPSGQMASFCGGIATEEELAQMDKGGNSNPSANNPFKNPNGPDPEAQKTEQNIKQDDDIDYTGRKEDFPDDLKKIDAVKCHNNIREYRKMIQDDIDYTTSLLKTLPKPTTTINEDGEMETLYDYNNDPHYIFFSKMHVDFERKRDKVYGDMSNQLAASSSSFATSYNGVFQAFTIALKSCTNPECVKAIKCDYYPRLAGTIRSYVMSIGDIVSTAILRQKDEAWDYISSSSPMLQFIAEPHWNHYLNVVREADIRMGKLMLMMRYQEFVSIAQSFMAEADALGTEGQCFTELRLMPPSVETPELKPLKTLAPPCKPDPVNDAPVNLGPFMYENNCQHTRYAIKLGSISKGWDKGPAKAEAELGAKAYFEKVKSKFVEDDKYRAGLELHAKAQAKIEVKADGTLGIIKAKSNAHAQVDANATIDEFWEFNQQGQLIKKGTAIEANASISGSASLDVALKDYKKSNQNITEQFNYGLAAKGEYSAVMGPDGKMGNYQFRNLTINTTAK